MSSYAGTGGRLVLWRDGQWVGEYAVAGVDRTGASCEPIWRADLSGTNQAVGVRDRRVELSLMWGPIDAPHVECLDWVEIIAAYKNEGELTVVGKVISAGCTVSNNTGEIIATDLALIPHDRLPEEFTEAVSAHSLGRQAAERARQAQTARGMLPNMSPVARTAAVAQAMAAAGVTVREAARALSNVGRATVNVVADAAAFNRAMRESQEVMDRHRVTGNGIEPPLGVVGPVSSDRDEPAMSVSLSGGGPSDILMTSDMSWVPAGFHESLPQPKGTQPTKPKKPKYGPETFFTRRRVRLED